MFYIIIRIKFGYFKMWFDNLSRLKINFFFFMIKDRCVYKYGLLIFIVM